MLSFLCVETKIILLLSAMMIRLDIFAVFIERSEAIGS